jgi:hypothetical protein
LLRELVGWDLVLVGLGFGDRSNGRCRGMSGCGSKSERSKLLLRSSSKRCWSDGGRGGALSSRVHVHVVVVFVVLGLAPSAVTAGRGGRWSTQLRCSQHDIQNLGSRGRGCKLIMFRAVNVGIAEALVSQQPAQSFVFVENFAGGGLDFLRSLCADGLTRAVFGLELCQVFLATGARSSLVVAAEGALKLAFFLGPVTGRPCSLRTGCAPGWPFAVVWLRSYCHVPCRLLVVLGFQCRAWRVMGRRIVVMSVFWVEKVAIIERRLARMFQPLSC